MESRVDAVAFFVFFAGTAGARIVAADFGACANRLGRFGLRSAGLILHFLFLALLFAFHFASKSRERRRRFFGDASGSAGSGCKRTGRRWRSLARRLRTAFA